MLSGEASVRNVISDEIIQETHVRGHERTATAGTMIGVVVTLALDVALG